MAASFSPLSSILKENKLTGPNYVDWKRNLDIVLTAERYKFVLTEPRPVAPPEGAPQEELEALTRWGRADEMAKCYILASLSPVLQQRHQGMVSAHDMIFSLHEMFADRSRSARFQAMHHLMNTRMSEGTPVREHVMKMMGFLNELELLGAELDGESQVDMVLQSLPDSFKQFRLNYQMQKMALSIPELMNELTGAEILIRSKASVMVAEFKSSTPKPKGKGQKWRKKKGKPSPADGDKGKKSTKKTKGKSKGECFFCGKAGHWKKDCLAKKNAEKSGVTGDQKEA